MTWSSYARSLISQKNGLSYDSCAELIHADCESDPLYFGDDYLNMSQQDMKICIDKKILNGMRHNFISCCEQTEVDEKLNLLIRLEKTDCHLHPTRRSLSEEQRKAIADNILIIEQVRAQKPLTEIDSIGNASVLQFIFVDRTQYIFKALEELWSRKNVPYEIAIPYGAGHLSFVEDFLLAKGYQPIPHSDYWLTVSSLEPSLAAQIYSQSSCSLFDEANEPEDVAATKIINNLNGGSILPQQKNAAVQKLSYILLKLTDDFDQITDYQGLHQLFSCINSFMKSDFFDYSLIDIQKRVLWKTFLLICEKLCAEAEKSVDHVGFWIARIEMLENLGRIDEAMQIAEQQMKIADSKDLRVLFQIIARLAKSQKQEQKLLDYLELDCLKSAPMGVVYDCKMYCLFALLELGNAQASAYIAELFLAAGDMRMLEVNGLFKMLLYFNNAEKPAIATNKSVFEAISIRKSPLLSLFGSYFYAKLNNTKWAYKLLLLARESYEENQNFEIDLGHRTTVQWPSFVKT